MGAGHGDGAKAAAQSAFPRTRKIDMAVWVSIEE